MGGTIRRRIIVTSEFRANVKGLKDVERLAEAQRRLDNANRRTRRGFGPLSGGLTRLRILYFNYAVVLGVTALAVRALIKPVLDLETAMVRVRKTTNLSAEAIKSLETDILNLSRSVPQSADELANIAAVAGQLGIKSRDDILEFTKVVNMMALATDQSSEEAALALGKLSVAFGLPTSQVEKLGSAINELENTTAANAIEIQKAMLRMAASAKLLGITVDVVGALSATLIAAGERPERAGTRMNAVFTRMATNVEGLASLFRRISGDATITAETIQKMLGEDANKVFIDMINLLAKVGDGMDVVQETTKLFGRVGAKNINQLVNNIFELQENMIRSSEAFREAISLQREFDLAMETTSNQMSIFFGNMRASITDFFRASNSGFGKYLQNVNLAIIETRKLSGVIEELAEEEGEGKATSFVTTKFVEAKEGESLGDFLKRIRREQKGPFEKLTEAEIFTLTYRFKLKLEGKESADEFVRIKEEALGLIKKKLTLEEISTEDLTELTNDYRDSLIEVNDAIISGSDIQQTAALLRRDEALEKINDTLDTQLAIQTELTAKEQAREALGFKQREITTFETITEAAERYKEQLDRVEVAKMEGLETFSDESQAFKELKEDINAAYDVGVIQEFIDATNKLTEDTLNAGKALGNLISKFGVKKGDIKFEKLQKFKSGESGPVLTGGATVIPNRPGVVPGVGSFGDFIARPNQPVASFSPDDTIIGVKDPSSLVNNKIGPVTIILQGSQSTFQNAQEISRQLKSLA